MARIVPPQRNWAEAEKVDWMNQLARRFVSGSFTWDPGSAGAGATLDTTLSSLTLYPQLKGLRAGQWVHVTPPATINSGLHVTAAWIPADDQIAVRLYNSTAGAIDAASGSWSFVSFVL